MNSPRSRAGKIPSPTGTTKITSPYSKLGLNRFHDYVKRHKTSKLTRLQYITFITLTLLSISLIKFTNTTTRNALRSRGSGDTSTNLIIHPSYQFDGVLYFDEAAMKNVRATFEGARSWLKWAAETILDVTVADKLEQFQTLPLLATVDRRPLTARKQMKLDKEGLHDNGNLLGCAVQATTFVSKIESLYLDTYKDFPVQCDVCFQFSNREDMDGFLPGVGYEPIGKSQESIATKCFSGTATNTARFASWQSNDERFEGFGYPFTVDCTLPNGIRELTCREISKMQNRIESTEHLQSIYLQTRFTLDGYFGDVYAKTFHVFSRWPWTALQSHDDDRRKIAKSLPKTWNDYSSKFVPSSVYELELLHIEGPGYSMGEYGGKPTLKSMVNNNDSKGGLHFRLLVNLFHLIRNAPHSTHMMAIVDGQARTSYNALKKLLGTKLHDLYSSYGDVFTDYYFLKNTGVIPIKSMKGKANIKGRITKMTLSDLLRLRGIKLHIVPITSPSLSFEKSVCGGQYTFAAYLAARFAADYHVMMYLDGDTAMIEGSSRSLQEILYERFFSKNSSKCAGHRIRLIEQFVKPEDDRTERVLQCSADVALNEKKWKYANKHCHLKEGHIAARTDSILAMSVHHPDTNVEYVPEGIEDCITPGNKLNDRYVIREDEFVQLHLRNRLRKDECVCFGDSE